MARTDVADVRESVKNTASTALDAAKAQAATAGESLAAATSSALERASEQSRKARKQAQQRAKALADEAAKSARKSVKKSTKKARKRADKAAAKANKKAHEINIAVQKKAGRKPRRGRKAAVLGGLALGGVVVVTVLKRKSAAEDPYAPSPTANTGSGLPGDPPPVD